jgi:hypothetical protein
MPAESDESRPEAKTTPFGNLLLALILCLFVPESVLSAIEAQEPGTLLRSIAWTPIIPPAVVLANLTHADWNSEWPYGAAACMIAVSLYWAARGIARAARRKCVVLTICSGLLLASYSLGAWWVLAITAAD